MSTPLGTAGSGLADVVVCAGGVRVARRAAHLASEEPDLQVGEVAPVSFPDSGAVEATRSDGVVWRRHWPGSTRLVIEFVDQAVAEVDDASGVVTFDRRLPPDAEEHLLFDHVLPLVLARRGLLVVHGAVISRHGTAVVLLGASGAGKSTLTAFAWQQGWTVGGDDAAVLIPTVPARVEPTYPTVRLTSASVELLGLNPAGWSAVVGKARLPPGLGVGAFSPDAVELGLVAIIEPADEGTMSRFERVGGIDAHAELFGYTFHAELSGSGLLPAVVEGLGRVVDTTAVGRLTVPHGVPGLAAAEQVLRTLVQPSGKRR